jgi:phosphatidylglycerol---prolipoprotein diacylglyceryl transferase
MSNGFTVFGLTIHYYGIIIMIGAVLAAFLAAKEAKRKKMDEETIWDMMPWLLVAGIIGARLWHVFTPPASSLINGVNPYFIHPLDALKIWNGGLGIPGAVMGGALALYVYCRVKKISFACWVDAIAPGLALAQAVGRWGNFVNQELYGLPSNLPWAIYIDPAHRLPGFENVATYQPTFLYESIWNLLNMALLLILARKLAKKLRKGDIFLIYMLFYSVGRFVLEFIRIDYSPIAGININQTLMVVIFFASLIGLVLRHLLKKPGTTEDSESCGQPETTVEPEITNKTIANDPVETIEELETTN